MRSERDIQQLLLTLYLIHSDLATVQPDIEIEHEINNPKMQFKIVSGTSKLYLYYQEVVTPIQALFELQLTLFGIHDHL